MPRDTSNQILLQQQRSRVEAGVGGFQGGRNNAGAGQGNAGNQGWTPNPNKVPGFHKNEVCDTRIRRFDKKGRTVEHTTDKQNCYICVASQIPDIKKYIADKRIHVVFMKRGDSDYVTQQVAEMLSDCISLDMTVEQAQVMCATLMAVQREMGLNPVGVNQFVRNDNPVKWKTTMRKLTARCMVGGNDRDSDDSSETDTDDDHLRRKDSRGHNEVPPAQQGQVDSLLTGLKNLFADVRNAAGVKPPGQGADPASGNPRERKRHHAGAANVVPQNLFPGDGANNVNDDTMDGGNRPAAWPPRPAADGVSGHPPPPPVEGD